MDSEFHKTFRRVKNGSWWIKFIERLRQRAEKEAKERRKGEREREKERIDVSMYERGRESERACERKSVCRRVRVCEDFCVFAR